MEPTKMTTKQLASAAMGIALITVCSWISVPTAVPFTLQTFAICLISALFGLKPALCTVGGYILLGAIGVPVFSGFAGGVGVLLGKTGGYILGFVLTGVSYLIAVKAFGENRWIKIAALVIGLIACYAVGTAWFMYIYLRDVGTIGLVTVLTWCVFPFILPDFVKMALALVVAKRVKPVIKE